MIRDRAALRLCLVTDRGLAADRPLPEVVAAAVRGGVTMVQLRDKVGTTCDLIGQAEVLLAYLRPRGIPLVINDRVDIALAVGADGVHVGQDDMPVDEVRGLIGPDKIVGLSITRADDLRRGYEMADYLGVGPVFSQTTKADASQPLGLTELTNIVRSVATPVMAIGGIGLVNVRDVLDCGVAGVAVVSAVMAASEPESAARRLAEIIVR